MKALNVLRKIRKIIDTVDDFVGSIAKYVLLAILFCMAFEVVARYGFNSPTIWALDMSKQFEEQVMWYGLCDVLNCIAASKDLQGLKLWNAGIVHYSDCSWAA